MAKAIRYEADTVEDFLREYLDQHARNASGLHILGASDFDHWVRRGMESVKHDSEKDDPDFDRPFGLEQMHALEQFYWREEDSSADTPRRSHIAMMIKAVQQVIHDRYDDQQQERPKRDTKGMEDDALWIDRITTASRAPNASVTADASFLPYKKIMPFSREQASIKGKLIHGLDTALPESHHADGSTTVCVNDQTIRVRMLPGWNHPVLGVHRDDAPAVLAAVEIERATIAGAETSRAPSTRPQESNGRA